MILEVETGRRPGPAALVIGAGLLASLLYAGARYLDLGPALACPWREGLGVRCPGCGTTAMLGHLLRGEPLAAVAANPLFAAIYLAFALVVLNALVGLAFGRRLALAPSRRQQVRATVLLVVALAANWVYVLSR